jgi:phage tail sheath protein FI
MPEYLAPGVYIEETSFRQKTIEGVSTSTAGFVGPARFGPIDGPPELLTSFADFERIFGNLGDLQYSPVVMPNYLAHAVRAFFVNGGRRLYVTRAFLTSGTEDHHARTDVTGAGSPPAAGTFSLRARFPGTGGNVRVTFTLRAGQNVRIGGQLRGVRPYDVVLLGTTGNLRPHLAEPVNGSPGAFRFRDAANGERIPSGADEVRVLVAGVEVQFPAPAAEQRPRVEVWEGLGFHALHANGIPLVFAQTITNRLKAMTTPFIFTTTLNAVGIARVLLDRVGTPGLTRLLAGEIVSFDVTLDRGLDGQRPTANEYDGADTDPQRKSGLRAFDDVQDISMVAAPGSSWLGATTYSANARQIMDHLISHCHRMQYRIAILDAPDNVSLSGIKEYRARVDSTHAALYYPWVRVLDPITNLEANHPPSGFVAGIFARNDVEKGVHKAPANEVVRLAVSFEVLLNKAQQDVLNPEGINCFRYFDGRGFRLWGARTVSSDPEWKYVNLRRYFAYLERSIERGTQWIVFENNTDKLWANVRRTVEDFLFNEWKSERLFGLRPEEAYFVRCDRTTMTQNDFDNGRLICLIGVSPVRPAEFVIFRIGQWTADRPQR